MVRPEVSSERVFSLLKELIKIRSVSGEEKEIGAFILDFLHNLNIETQVIEKAGGRPNIICTLGDKGPLIAYHGHIDTVDVLDRDQWSRDPFDPYEDAKFIYGRGSFDMKCGVAAMMHMVELISKDQSKLNCRVMFMFLSDEEKGSEFGSKLLIRKMEKYVIERPDFMISGEESWGFIRNADRGGCKAKITFKGKSSHTSHARKEGINAITNAARGVLALEKDLDITHPNVGRAIISVNSISTDNEHNKVPGYCDISVDLRSIPTMDLEQINSILQGRLDPLKKEYPKESEVPFDYEMKIDSYMDATITPGEHPMIVRFADCVAKITDKQPEFFVRDAGCTDNRFFRSIGVPCIIFGPEGYADHGPDERVNKESVILMAKAYLDFVLSF